MLVTLSKAQNVKSHKHVETLFGKDSVPCDKLHTVTAEYRYSSIIFENGRRRGDHFKYIGNTLIYDVDNDRKTTLSLGDAIKLFEHINCLIVTTKSHRTSKNGKVADRFRILLLLEQDLELSKHEYPKFYLHVASLLGIGEVVDVACKDVARMYQPNAKQEVYYSGSDNILSSEQLVSSFQEVQHDRATVFQTPSLPQDGTKTAYLRSIIGTKKMQDLLKKERFTTGNRNNYLFSSGKYLLDSGLSTSEVKQILLWINEEDGITIRELESTVFKSLKL